MAAQLNTIMELFDGPNGTSFAIGTAALVILLTIVVAWIISRSGNKRNTILLIGLSDAGKTLLFTRLNYGKFLTTHTSIKENKGNYKLNIQNQPKKVLELIDVPGNEKLRGKFIDQFKDLARGIIFVVDCVNFPREVHAVAECLFDILSNKTFNKLSPKLLIACNKQDLTTSKSANVIKSQLAKEMFIENVRLDGYRAPWGTITPGKMLPVKGNVAPPGEATMTGSIPAKLAIEAAVIVFFPSNTLRKTRAAAVKGLDEQAMNKDSITVGQKDKDFDFADLRGIQVDFIECSAKGNAENEADLKNIEAWLNKLI